MLVVCFEFCLALPEVIHLPRGLEAVTRNWRNHDSTKLSASTVPGWGIWCTGCSSKRWEHFSLYGFFMPFFSTNPIFFFSQYFSSLPPCLPEHPRHWRIREHVYLDKMTRKSKFCRYIEVVMRWWQRQETLKERLQVLRKQPATCLWAPIEASRAYFFLPFDPKYHPWISASMFRRSVGDEACLMKNMVMSQEAALCGTSLWQSDKPVQSAWMARPSECPGCHQTDSSQRTWAPSVLHMQAKLLPPWGLLLVLSMPLNKGDLSLFMTGARFADRCVHLGCSLPSRKTSLIAEDESECRRRFSLAQVMTEAGDESHLSVSCGAQVASDWISEACLAPPHRSTNFC